jgi:plasmid replication initiation protein
MALLDWSMGNDELTLFPNGEDKSKRRWVTVSNKMIMARLDWDIMMHRILMVLISQIDSKNDEEFQLQRVPVRYIRDLAEVSQKSIHSDTAEAAAKLVREPFEFWSPDEKDYEGYPIFAVCKYKSGEGVIEAKFNEDARPFLLQLREHFTQYRLKQAIPLSTPYAIRMYEIAKMIERPGQRRSRQIPIDRFRSMFKLENKYKRHTDMRRRVINPSVEEVNEKTDVKVICKDVRDGQTPVALNLVVVSEEHGPEETEDELPSRNAPDPPEEREYETWFEGLDDDEREEVMTEARQRAKNQGYSKDQPRSFSAGVMQAVNQIYLERTEAEVEA